MRILPTKKKSRKGEVTRPTRKAALALYGRQCYWPTCTLPITKENYLVIHDITETGDHSEIKQLRPLCLTHHNRLTNITRGSRAKIARFRARGIPVAKNECPTFWEEFFGPAK